jgi:hypothetical protein
MPGQKRQARPPDATGFYWRKEGVGWDLRRSIYVEENGVRKRKQPYVAHLSNPAFQEMKRQHKGTALERASFLSAPTAKLLSAGAQNALDKGKRQ